MRTLTSLICRILFVLAFVLAGFAIWEKLANLAGYTVLRGALGPGRLLEIATMSLLFVVALLLREINHSLRARGTT
jgi:hypothetical protein